MIIFLGNFARLLKGKKVPFWETAFCTIFNLDTAYKSLLFWAKNTDTKYLEFLLVLNIIGYGIIQYSMHYFCYFSTVKIRNEKFKFCKVKKT